MLSHCGDCGTVLGGEGSTVEQVHCVSRSVRMADYFLFASFIIEFETIVIMKNSPASWILVLQ